MAEILRCPERDKQGCPAERREPEEEGPAPRQHRGDGRRRQRHDGEYERPGHRGGEADRDEQKEADAYASWPTRERLRALKRISDPATMPWVGAGEDGKAAISGLRPTSSLCAALGPAGRRSIGSAGRPRTTGGRVEERDDAAKRER